MTHKCRFVTRKDTMTQKCVIISLSDPTKLRKENGHLKHV